ncbi:uncharacterized protein Tco025E_02571 [Trypanosoma conorhini]|uniref:Uncharacterized protein n=1 Tax=Trypanosoma conorhini TaxID=83891 RepID=A0A422Q2X3_9TRYP|nr:uncharacterized protein Tco025E_02571 [Trypanosoma conorhini]RNF24282.1 hypothetical protein Tco025E_02571 [Trypanosoma conorhini]
MTQAVPQCLLQLLEDYTLQALDAAQDVSDEFEEELTELTSRAERIQAVLQLLRDFERSRPTPASPAASEAILRSSPKALTQFALQALGQMSRDLTGVPDARAAAQELTAPSFGLQPIGRPVSLAEAALDLFARNTKVVSRRVEKRRRDADTAGGESRQEAALKRSVFSHLAEEQRERRLALYTARTALFPRATPLPTLSIKGGEDMLPPFVAPAVREFAALNVEAECRMLSAFYRVDAKAQLLRELPGLRSSIRHLQESLHAAGVLLQCRCDGMHEGGTQPWLEFPFVGEGVIRILVRQSLLLDVTWDSVRGGGQWRVLSLHWLLRAQTLPEILQRQTSAPCVCDGEVDKQPLSYGGALRVQPAHSEATVRYLTNCLETGLESGCLGALRVVNAVVMEVVETQCKALRERFFVGPLESSFMLDVRPGTHVALKLELPPTMGSEQGGALHVKYKLCLGTIVVERRRGTDTRMTHQSDLYADSLVRLKPSPAVVVDVESFVWQLATA